MGSNKPLRFFRVEFQWFLTALSVLDASGLSAKQQSTAGGAPADGPAGQMLRNQRPLVATDAVQVHDLLVLLWAERLLANVRVQLVQPSANGPIQFDSSVFYIRDACLVVGICRHQLASVTRQRQLLMVRTNALTATTCITTYLSRQLLPLRPGIALAMTDQFRAPCLMTKLRSCSSSWQGVGSHLDTRRVLCCYAPVVSTELWNTPRSPGTSPHAVAGSYLPPRKHRAAGETSAASCPHVRNAPLMIRPAINACSCCRYRLLLAIARCSDNT
jgi:hypothetical protein